MISNPKPVRERFGIRFSIVARRWRRELDASLAAVGLSDATWTPLVHLDETGGGISQKQLASLVGVDASTLVRLVDILEQKAWITRRPDENDGRSRLVYLTEEGRVQVRHIRAQLEQAEKALLEGIGDEELASTLSFIDELDSRLLAAQRLRTGGEQ